MITTERVREILDRKGEIEPEELAHQLSKVLGRNVGLSEVVSPTAEKDLMAEARGEKPAAPGYPSWLAEGQASPL